MASNVAAQGEKPRSTPRDLFLHLFSLVALVTCVSAFTGTVFQLLNIAFPVVELEGFGMRDSAVYELRGFLSSLIVFFPAYIWSVWYIERTFRMDPTRRFLGIRKWLTYLILFIIGITILTNLVVTINTLLGGETTLRFILKALTVFVVALGVGAYYISSLRRHATH